MKRSSGDCFVERNPELESVDVVEFHIQFPCSVEQIISLWDLEWRGVDFVRFPVILANDPLPVIQLTEENIKLAKFDWSTSETSWQFKCHPLVAPFNFKKNYENIIGKSLPIESALKKIDMPEGALKSRSGFKNGQLQDSNSMGGSLRTAFIIYQAVTNHLFRRIQMNEEQLNKFFIQLYGLGDHLAYQILPSDVTVNYIVDSREHIPA